MGTGHSLRESVFREGIEEKSQVAPLRTATFVALTYVFAAAAYIVVSGYFAESASVNVEGLAYIERYKGIGFVMVTGAALFMLLLVVLRRMERKDNTIISQNKSILASEHLVTTGIFSSSVFHDINNLLEIVVVSADLLRRSEFSNPEDVRRVEQLLKASDDLVKLVRQTMSFGRGHVPGATEQTDLAGLLHTTVEFARVHRKVKGCELKLEVEDGVQLEANSTLLSRAVMNLILNAAEATGGKGGILVRLGVDNGLARVEVHDDGPGFSDDVRRRMLEPFFTTKPDGNGLGLLSLKHCADEHRGDYEFGSSELGGARVCLVLPLDAPVSPNRSAVPAA